MADTTASAVAPDGQLVTLAGLLAGAPGPQTAAVLAAIQPADVTTSDLIDLAAGYERLVAWAQAGTLAATAELDRRFDLPSAAPDPAFRPHPFEPTGTERLAAELGCALGVSGQSARIKIDLAKALHDRLPWVADALAAGLIDQTRARVLAEETAHLDDDHAAGVVLAMLTALANAANPNGISGMTSGQLRQRSRAAVTTIDPKTAARRAKKARADRDVYLTPEHDGMASLSAVLPETDAVASYYSIEQAARALIAADRAAGLPPRPIGQARADALVDLLTGRITPARTHSDSGDRETGGSGGSGRSSAPTTLITITVPLAALLAGLTGPDDIPHHNPDHSSPNDTSPDHSSPEDSSPVEYGSDDGADDGAPPLAWTLAGLDRPMPGELSGLGPVTPATAREATLNALDRLRHLAGGRVGVRWIAIDHHGHATAVTGTSYTPPPLLRAALQARDRTCRFPGCTRPAHHCDCDHIQPYPTGTTTTTNTTSLCRAHHRLKTLSGWTLTPDHTGTLTWTSPTGHTYRTHPGLWTDPHEPPHQDQPPDHQPPDHEPPPPPDPALTWTDTEYQAWVDHLCQQAQHPHPQTPEATGPDLPTTWWANHLDDGSDDDRPDDNGSDDGWWPER